MGPCDLGAWEFRTTGLRDHGAYEPLEIEPWDFRAMPLSQWYCGIGLLDLCGTMGL